MLISTWVSPSHSHAPEAHCLTHKDRIPRGSHSGDTFGRCSCIRPRAREGRKGESMTPHHRLAMCTRFDTPTIRSRSPLRMSHNKLGCPDNRFGRHTSAIDHFCRNWPRPPGIQIEIRAPSRGWRSKFQSALDSTLPSLSLHRRKRRDFSTYRRPVSTPRRCLAPAHGPPQRRQQVGAGSRNRSPPESSLHRWTVRARKVLIQQRRCMPLGTLRAPKKSVPSCLSLSADAEGGTAVLTRYLIHLPLLLDLRRLSTSACGFAGTWAERAFRKSVW